MEDRWQPRRETEVVQRAEVRGGDHARKALAETPYDPIAADLMRQVLVATPPAPPTSSPVPIPLVHTIVPVLPDKTTLTPACWPRSPGASITKRFVLTPSDHEKLDAFLFRLEQSAKTQVPFSVVMRAMLSLIMQAEKDLLVGLAQGFPVTLPSTHDSSAQASFEQAWISHFAQAMFSRLAHHTRKE